MRGASSIGLRQLEGMSIEQMLAMAEDLGYCTEALSNDELYELLVSVLDGHEDEGGDPEDLDFTADFRRGRDD